MADTTDYARIRAEGVDERPLVVGTGTAPRGAAGAGPVSHDAAGTASHGAPGTVTDEYRLRALVTLAKQSVARAIPTFAEPGRDRVTAAGLVSMSDQTTER